MLIHVKMPQITTSTLLGIKKPPEAYSDSPSRFRKIKEMKPIAPTGLDCPISRCLSSHGAEHKHLCVCTRSGRCVFTCVLSSSDISSNVVDISRGFEDLILLCLKSCVLPSSKHWGKGCSRAGSVPCLQGLTLQHLEQPVLTHPKCDQEKASTIHCQPFTDD